MSAYADIVRYRAGWLAFPEAFEGEEGRPAPLGARSKGSRRSAWPVAAGLVAVAIVVALWRLQSHEPPRDPDAITALIENASATGLVLPGGEAGAARQGPLYRSGPAPVDGAEPALDRLRDEYERSHGSSRDACRLASALIATGQLDQARGYIAEGLAGSPGDERLLTLAGIAAHGAGDYETAERKLAAALDASPGNATAMLDLALVLSDAGKFDQAKPYLSEVIRSAPRSPLAERARRVLAQHSRP